MDARKRLKKGVAEETSAKSISKQNQDQNCKVRKDTKPAKNSLSCLKVFLILDLCLILCVVYGYFASPITALPYHEWEDTYLTGKHEVQGKLTSGVK